MEIIVLAFFYTGKFSLFAGFGLVTPHPDEISQYIRIGTFK